MACTVVAAMPVLRQEYTVKLPHEVVGAPSDSGRNLVRRRGWTTKRVAGDTIAMRSFQHHPLCSAGLTALFFVALLRATLLGAACDAAPPSVWETCLRPPAGADPSTDAGPSIRQALGELRAAAQGGGLERAVLRFAAGEYPLADTLVLDHAALGDFRGELVLEGPPDAAAVLLGSAPIEGWQPAAEDELAPEAKGKVWVAPLTVASPKALFDGHGLLPRARSRGFIPPAAGATPTALGFPADLLPADDTVAGLELSVRPRWLWIHNILPVATLDRATGRGTTAIPATYAIAPMNDWGPAGQPSAWFENRAVFIRQPGDWATSPDGRQVYLWPRDGGPPAGIRGPRLIELVRIEGDEKADTPLTRITLRRLSFAQADRESIAPHDAGLQHDWDFHDKANALLRLRWVEHVTVEHCRFSESGGSGLRADLHARHVRILGNIFRGLGGGGVLLCGYGPGTKDVNNHNVIHGNLIEDCGRLLWHRPGIHLWQSGDNEVTRNLVRDLPYSGIVVSGNGQVEKMTPEQRAAPAREQMRTVRWDETGDGPFTHDSFQPFLHSRNNLVAGNEVTRVVQTLGDGNGIYIRFASHAGNVIRGNYVHNIDGPRSAGGIRCDDLQHGVVVAGNLIERVTHGGITLNGARSTIRNNFLIDVLNPGNSDLPILFKGYVILWNDLVHGAVIERNVFCDNGRGEPEFYSCGFASWLPGATPPQLGELGLRDNLYWVNGQAGWAEAFVAANQAAGIDPGSIAIDPGMHRDADGRPRFDPDVLRRLGIEPFAWDQVGLPRDRAKPH